MFKKAISLIVSCSLLLTQPVFAQGVAELNIGKYLSQMPALNTDSFRPAHLRYISYDIKSNDFKLLLDQGDFEKSPGRKVTRSPEKSENALKNETKNLFNYFLIGLSLPNDKFWVNLRPDAPEQIIDPELEKTDMGRIMLEADLQLKKDTAGWTSPQNPEGREYWDKLYKKAGELFGSENITIPTITRPWIVPGEVIIREGEEEAYIYKANLKVMLEEDYLRGTKEDGRGTIIDYSFNDSRMKELNKYSTQLIKELILPKLTQEINTSKKYAQLRQVFFSLILSRWFKDRFSREAGSRNQIKDMAGKDKYQGYSVGNGLEPFPTIDSGDLTNLTSQDPWSKDYYFSEYKKSFQQGEYNLKEQITTPTGQIIRSYVSGGVNVTGEAASPLIGGGYKAIKTTLYVFLLTSLGFLSVPGNVALAKTSLEIGDERALLPVKYLWTGQYIRFLIIDVIEREILRKSKIALPAKLYNKKDVTLKDVYMWAVEIEKSNPEISKEIKDKINKLKEKIQLICNTRSKEISKILDTFKYKLAGMRAEDMDVGFLPEELRRGFAEVLRNIEKKPDIFLDWIDEAVTRIREAPGKEKSARENLKMRPFSEKFETLFWDIELRLLNVRLGIVKDIYQSLGESSSPLNAAKMAKEFYDTYIVNGKYKEHPAFSNANNAQDIKNILTSIFKNQMLTNYPDEGDKAKVAREIISGYFIIEPDAAFTSVTLKHFIIQLKNDGVGASSALTKTDAVPTQMAETRGGIDFTQINYLARPIGSFQGLDLRLPLLSKVELEGMNINRELVALEQMINAKIDVSTDRLKRLLAAMSQKDAFTAQRETQLLPLLLRLCWLKEEKGEETTPDFRAVLLIADTGLFVEQGNTRYSLN